MLLLLGTFCVCFAPTIHFLFVYVSWDFRMFLKLDRCLAHVDPLLRWYDASYKFGSHPACAFQFNGSSLFWIYQNKKLIPVYISILKSRDITLTIKVCLVKDMVFPVVMYGCESWTIKKTEHRRIDAFWMVVLEKSLESPLDCKNIKPVNPKGNQSWIFIGRTDAVPPILWPPDVKD